MKIRQRKAAVMARIKANNKHIWFVAPFLKQFHKLKARNDRIASLVRRMS